MQFQFKKNRETSNEEKKQSIYLVVVHDAVHVFNPISVHGSVKKNPLFIGGFLCQENIEFLQ